MVSDNGTLNNVAQARSENWNSELQIEAVARTAGNFHRVQRRVEDTWNISYD